MNIQLFGSRIGVSLKETTQTEAGLFLPEQYEAEVVYGHVKFVGNGDNGVPITGISVGDLVAFRPTAGSAVKLGEEKIIIMHTAEVMFAVIPDTKGDA